MILIHFEILSKQTWWAASRFLQGFSVDHSFSIIFLSYAVLCTEQGRALEFFSFLCTGQETACSGRGVTFLAAFIRQERFLPKDTIHLSLLRKGKRITMFEKSRKMYISDYFLQKLMHSTENAFSLPNNYLPPPKHARAVPC